MEDMAEFQKLTETLARGGVGDQVLLAIQRAMEFVGRLHAETWLPHRSVEEAELLMDRCRYFPD